MNAFVPAVPSKLDLRPLVRTERTLVIRTPSGLSGDMLVAGLSRLLGLTADELSSIVASIGVPELDSALTVVPHSVNAISGWQARLGLPKERAHRTLRTILDIIAKSSLPGAAQQLAVAAFRLLAEAEARVHGVPMDDVSFHEVGALDSILDTCVAATLFDRLKVTAFHCSPLPICDGVIRCEHGLIPSPAPAVQELLAGVAVRGVGSTGETVTPTAIAFLRAAGARFGPWPAMTVDQVVRAYGGRILPGIPNGAIFAVGSPDPSL